MKRQMLGFAIVSLLVLAGVSAWAQNSGLDESRFYAKSWAVVIGINAYGDFPSLEYALNDARAVGARFERMGFELIALLDQQATKENILDVLKNQLPQQVAKDDRLVIFYAGHGAAGILPNGDEVGFIIPTDGKSIVDGRQLEIIGGRIEVDEYESFADKANFISVGEIREISDVVPAKHVFYVIDGCYSGFLDPAVYAGSRRSSRRTETVASVESGDNARGLIIDEQNLTGGGTGGDGQSKTTATDARPQLGGNTDYLDLLTSRDTVQILSAGSSGEEVYEKSGHGIFTYYLLRALDGVADLNKDCVVRASELGTYLKQVVPDASHFSQTPLFNRISGEGELIFIPPICKPIAQVDLHSPKKDEAWSKTDAYSGPKSSRYKAPTHLQVDENDQLYVLDSKLQKIFKFDTAGQLLHENFDQTGRAVLDKSLKPYSMAPGYGGQVWVFYADPGKKKSGPAGKILVYDGNGTVSRNWSDSEAPLDSCKGRDDTDVEFPAKALIALDVEENLILVDQKSGVMMKCDRNGNLLHRWGDYGKHEIIEDINRYKTVNNPQGMAVDMFGYIYVADTEGHGIQKFFDGEWIPSWPNVKGKKPFFFDSPHGIAVDNKLYVYVADTKNHRIKKYTSGGEKLMAYWGRDKAKKGKKYGEFNEPYGVAVNHDSTKIYVADTGNKRIQRFLIER